MPQTTSASKYISAGISGYHGCGNSLLNKRKAFSCKQKLHHWKKNSESPKKEIKFKLNYYVQDKTIVEESTNYDFTNVLHVTFNFFYSLFFCRENGPRSCPLDNEALLVSEVRMELFA